MYDCSLQFDIKKPLKNLAFSMTPKNHNDDK